MRRSGHTRGRDGGTKRSETFSKTITLENNIPSTTVVAARHPVRWARAPLLVSDTKPSDHEIRGSRNSVRSAVKMPAGTKRTRVAGTGSGAVADGHLTLSTWSAWSAWKRLKENRDPAVTGKLISPLAHGPPYPYILLVTTEFKRSSERFYIWPFRFCILVY